MGGSAGEIVGRDEELRAIEAFVEAAREGSASLVLEGPAGIGKTTVWREALAAAERRGMRVLVARPAANEAAFAFAAVGDLLERLPEEVADGLPPPQRRALRVVRAVEEADEPVEPHLVGVALLAALRELAASAAVLVAVDDVQWLDTASADAIAFAARRLTREPVRLVATRRTGEPGEAPVLPQPVERLAVGPLSVGAVQRLLAARLDLSLGRSALRRVFEVAGGNPLYALELGRSVAGGEPGLRDPVPVPKDLAALLRERLDSLPAETGELLLATALLLEPTLELLEKLAGRRVWGRLEPALRAQLVEVDGRRVRFAHPLFAAAVVEAGDPLLARDLHERAADVVDNPTERARHLALAREPPDEEIAAALAAAAERERLRGAAFAAADLAHEAWRFTGDPEQRTSRLLRACECRLLVGGFAEVAARLEPELEAVPPGPARARALFLLARAEYGGDRKAELLEEALAHAGDDAALHATILMEQMSFRATGELIPVDAERALGEAVRLARAAGDEDLEDRCRGNHAWVLALLGRPISPAAHLRRHALSDDAERARAVQLLWRGEVEAARELLLLLRRRAEEVGEEWSRLLFTLHLFELETRRGDWPAARAVDAELAAAGAGIPSTGPILRRTEALLAAARGDRAAAESAADAVSGSRDRWQALEAARASGLAALSVGDATAAADRLGPVFAETLAAGFRDPGAIPVAPDLAEALVQLGRDDEAHDVLVWLEERAREQSHPWAFALAARVRGLLERDETALRRSLEELGRLSLPFERARSLLALGALLRRTRRRSEARAALGEAGSVFQRLDAVPWAARAQEEAMRIGGRASAGTTLTPAEHRVAVLVAEGRTKKEVAAALFLSVHTVDSTLRRVYAKLGVRTRVDLARRLG